MIKITPLEQWHCLNRQALAQQEIWLGFVAKNEALPVMPLSKLEKIRLANMQSEKRAQEFSRGRFALRYALSLLLGCDVDVEILPDAFGRLYLPKFLAVKISLSHFDGNVLIGVADNCSMLGVDLVLPRYNAGLKLAKRILTKVEYDAWSLLPVKRQQDFLFQTWAMKEALIKAFGGSVWDMRKWQINPQIEQGDQREVFFNGDKLDFNIFLEIKFNLWLSAAWRD